MPVANFEKKKEKLIIEITNRITEEKELEAFSNMLNKFMAKKTVKTKKVRKTIRFISLISWTLEIRSPLSHLSLRSG